MARSPFLTLCLFLLGGCGADPADRPDDPADAPAPAFRADTLVPADSVPLWIREIREGIAPLAGQVGPDPEGARQRAVELYVTRQERIEQTVGRGAGSDSTLAASVLEAETRFHTLMQLLGSTPPPDSTRVAVAVADLDTELGRVLGLLQEAAAPPAGP